MVGNYKRGGTYIPTYLTVFRPLAELEWVREWLLFNTNSAIFQLYHGWEQVIFQWYDDEVHFVLDQHAELDFYSASSLKQQFAGRHVAPLEHIILIPSQPVCSFFLMLRA